MAGTICGDILVYSANLEVSPPPPAAAAASQSVVQPKSGGVLKHMQTHRVCGGSVQCLAWSKDSRYQYIILYICMRREQPPFEIFFCCYVNVIMMYVGSLPWEEVMTTSKYSRVENQRVRPPNQYHHPPC